MPKIRIRVRFDFMFRDRSPVILREAQFANRRWRRDRLNRIRIRGGEQLELSSNVRETPKYGVVPFE